VVHGIMVACNCCLTEPVVHVYIVHTYIYIYIRLYEYHEWTIGQLVGKLWWMLHKYIDLLGVLELTWWPSAIIPTRKLHHLNLVGANYWINCKGVNPISKTIPTWGLSNCWLVVYLLLWKIWKSVGSIIPNIWKKRVPNHQAVNNSIL